MSTSLFLKIKKNLIFVRHSGFTRIILHVNLDFSIDLTNVCFKKSVGSLRRAEIKSIMTIISWVDLHYQIGQVFNGTPLFNSKGELTLACTLCKLEGKLEAGPLSQHEVQKAIAWALLRR